MGRAPRPKVTDLLRPLAVLFCLALLVPASALAQEPAPPQIDGSPLNVWTTPDGRVQVALDGAPGGFFAPSSAGQPGPTPNAGITVVLAPGDKSTPQGYGIFNFGGFPTPDSGPSANGGNVTAAWALKDAQGAPAIRLTQLPSYAIGTRQVDATYTLDNIGARAISFRTGWVADLAI